MRDKSEKDLEEGFNTFAFNELLRDRRRERLWRNFRFAAFISLAVAAMIIQAPMFNQFRGSESDEFKDADYVATLTISGVIQENNVRGSDEGLRSQLQGAFSDEDAKGVMIKVSSPGGTPVQSELIYERIERLKERYDKKVIIVGEEALASGAYLIAMAGDKVYAQPSTIVGSIGVRMSTFGASELIEKLGVERRIYTAGENKVTMDTFKEEDPKAVEHAQSILNDIHDQFIGIVAGSRGDRIDMDNEQLFSGLYWTGRQGIELGLVDGVMTASDALEQEFGTRKVRRYGPSNNILTRLGLVLRSTSEILAGTKQTTVESVWTP